MNLTLKIWRQKSANDKGKIVEYQLKDIHEDMSFLEMMDVLNEDLIKSGHQPVAFDHDCREGICGSCSLYINGEAHGPGRAVTTCQLHMREFKDGEVIYIEPWRAKAFPVVKDLVVDRSAFDRVIQAGGTYRLTLRVIHKMLTLCQFQKQMQIVPLMQLLVLVVVPVSQAVKIHQQCYLFLQKYLSWHYFLKDK